MRSLVATGVRSQNIYVSHATAMGGAIRTPPEPSSSIAVGASAGAAVGGVLALISLIISIVSISAGTLTVSSVMTRLIGGVAVGAMLGGVLALLLGTPRRQSADARPFERSRPYSDFLVSVKARDEHTAETVRGLLARRGGELLPA